MADGVIAPDEFVALVDRRAARAERTLVGVTGPPGSGKSSLADLLRRRLDAVVVPMDGFHLSNAVLDARRLRERKGAPETFDAPAFAELVVTLRAGDRDVDAPDFDRRADEPTAAAIRVPVTTGLVVVEGNYLLLDHGAWAPLGELWDLVAYVDLDPTVRRSRLVDRHVRHGRTRAAAEEFVGRSDEANARLVERTRGRADVYVAAPSR